MAETNGQYGRSESVVEQSGKTLFDVLMSRPVMMYESLSYDEWTNNHYITKFKLVESLTILFDMNLMPDMTTRHLSFTILGTLTPDYVVPDLIGPCVLSFDIDSYIYELSCNFSFSGEDDEDYEEPDDTNKTVLNGFYILRRINKYNREDLIYHTNYDNEEPSLMSGVIKDLTILNIIELTGGQKFTVYQYNNFTGNHEPFRPDSDLPWSVRQTMLRNIINDYTPDFITVYHIADNIKLTYQYDINNEKQLISQGKIHGYDSDGGNSDNNDSSNSSLSRAGIPTITDSDIVKFSQTHSHNDIKSIARNLNLSAEGSPLAISNRIHHAIQQRYK